MGQGFKCGAANGVESPVLSHRKRESLRSAALSPEQARGSPRTERRPRLQKNLFSQLTQRLSLSSQARLGNAWAVLWSRLRRFIFVAMKNLFPFCDSSRALILSYCGCGIVRYEIRCRAANGVESHPSQKPRRLGHPRYCELRRAGKVGHPPESPIEVIIPAGNPEELFR